MSGVLSFHAITSKIRETCVPALTYSFSACSIEKLGVADGRSREAVQVRLRLIRLETTIPHGNSTSDQQSYNKALLTASFCL